MPAIAKTSDERVLAAARAIVARGGAEALSMQALAERVGVRAPSLYKRFSNRDAILDGVLEGVLVELTAELRAAAHGKSPAEDLRRMAALYRAFAHAQPHLYALMFGKRHTDPQIVAQRAAAVEPVFACLQRWLPPAQVLPAARTLVAYLHGFVTMELDGAFHLGGDVGDAFAFGVRTLITALEPAR